MTHQKSVPAISVTYAQKGSTAKANELGMRPMQERAYQKRGEQYLLLKSPPASGKSRALMFIALDKLYNQKLKQAIIVVPEKSIGSSFHNEPLSKYGFWADWEVEPKWNLCNAPGSDDGGKVKSVKAFLDGDSKVLVCTHATFRFAVDNFGVEVFDDCLIAVDEFHHVSANPDNRLGAHLGDFIVLNNYLVRDLKELNLWNQEMSDQLKYFDGDLSNIPTIPQEIKDRYATAFDIEHSYLIEAAARRQKWIDQSQSVNLFLSEPNIKTLSHMYRSAWRKGLKTTYYLRTQGASNIEKATVSVKKETRGLGEKKTFTEAEKVACSIEAMRNGEECEACQ